MQDYSKSPPNANIIRTVLGLIAQSASVILNPPHMLVTDQPLKQERSPGGENGFNYQASGGRALPTNDFPMLAADRA